MMTSDRGVTSAVLERLIAPISAEVFFTDHWQIQPLLVKRGLPGFFDDLITIEDVDRLVSTTALPLSQVDIGRDAVGAAKAAYGNGTYASAKDALRLHREGNTIILRAMQLWLPKLQDLCSELEEVFRAECQTNLYMTPPQTQSSYPHWDAHDIFVIQLLGSKRWTLYESDLKLPLRYYEFDRNRHHIG